MKKKDENKKQDIQHPANEDTNDLPGYPIYPASDDIYNKSKKK